MNIDEKDVETIALMHIRATLSADACPRSGPKFRFFRDKVRLFLEFDSDSVILERNGDGLIAGVLIYTYDERAFNRFCGPSNLRFWVRAIKTAVGYYGFSFAKFAKAAVSMLGKGARAMRADVDPTLDDDYAKIWVLLVAEEERGKGMAGALLARCAAAAEKRGARSLVVTVRTDNAPAIRAYEKAGFAIVGECEESSGRSHVMALTLENRG